jgi:hypothetical protein
VSWLPVVLIALPLALSVFFGLFAFKHLTPLAYHCLRCGADFRKPPHRRFPVRCRACGARDWNASSPSRQDSIG